MSYKEVIQFWFEELEPAQWWKKSDAFDRMVSDRFMKMHRAAAAAETADWREHAQGRLAEVIVLDQFSRNMFRGQAESFAFDAQALVLAQEAIAVKADEQLSTSECCFLYMPFMHSESKLIHEQAVALFSKPGIEGNLDFELRHKAIIDRFGRYPHRNELLGRQSTAEELAFLSEPGSSF